MQQYNFNQQVPRENTNSVKYDLRNKLFGEKDVLPMWVADMDFETPDFIREAIAERANHPIYGYTFRSESYTNSIQNWVKRRHNWSTEKEWFVFSPGIVPAINFAVLSLTKPGDGVLIQSPVYFPFFSAIKDHKRELLNNQLCYQDGQYTIDFDDFENKAKKAKLFLLSNPHNPVGRVWRRDELLKMANICLKHHVTILSDEIHNDLILSGNKHEVLANLSAEIAAITLTCIAPSKTFNMAGLATSSVVVSDEKLRTIFTTFIDHLHLSGGNIFGSVASEAGYTHGESWLNQLMLYVKNNVSFLNKELSNNTSIKMVIPEATYMAWLDFSAFNKDDDWIKNKLIKEAKLGLSPGPMFGPGGEGFQRINLATPYVNVQKAAQNIIKVFK